MFRLYSSSAGSGKTYTLTKEYLKLILNGGSDTYFRHVLAVTFTNAAATEMKERILGILQLFAGGNAKEHPMFQDIINELFPETVDDALLRNDRENKLITDSNRIFTKILHSYSDFAVLTIDKFTKRLVSSFTDELGLPYNFETEVDAQLLEEAVNRLLARVGKEGEEALTVVLEGYFMENAMDGKGWNALSFSLQNAARDLLNESTNEALGRLEPLNVRDWLLLRKKMSEFIWKIEKELVAYGQNAVEIIEKSGLGEKDFFYGSKGIYGYFQDKSKGENLWLKTPNSYVVKTIEEGKWGGSKASATVLTQLASVESALTDIFTEIENIRCTNKNRYLTYQALLPHLYNTSLLEEIRKEFRNLLREENMVHISEFNQRISEIVMAQPVPLIFERLGEKYHHILIDEFQDTSKLQFLNLLPLIENSLAYGYFNLVVGDAKQAIYRFRGGDMDLIVHLGNEQLKELYMLLGAKPFLDERLYTVFQSIQKSMLRVNRRSYKEVTTFNNDFFDFTTRLLAAENPTLNLVFDENFKQEIAPQAPVGGHVEIAFLEKSKDDPGSQKDPMIERTLGLVTELKEQGYHWRDFAILCRGRKEAATLAVAFKESGIPLISEDSLLVSYAVSVKFMIAMIKVLSVQDNSASRYGAIWWFYQLKYHRPPSTQDDQMIREISQKTANDYFLSYFDNMGYPIRPMYEKQPGIYELCEQICGVFDLYQQGGEREYLLRFMDVVLEFTTKKNTSPSDFLLRWEELRGKVSIALPEGSDAVRFTTIHKSKGLEYPVVILPYCQWSFDVKPGSSIWADLTQLDYPELVVEENEVDKISMQVGKINLKKEMSETDLGEVIRQEQERTLVENLNLLYVAFTRPVERLYVLAEKQQLWNKTKLVSYLFYEYLNQGMNPVWEEGKLQYILSEGSNKLNRKEQPEDNAPVFELDVIESHAITTTLAVQATRKN